MDIVFASDRKDVVPCIKLRFGSADTKALSIALNTIIDHTRGTRARPKIRFGKNLVGPTEALERYTQAQRSALGDQEDGHWTFSNTVVVYFPIQLKELLTAVLEALELHVALVRRDIRNAWNTPARGTRKH